jgi:putative DNA primase/helicase
LRIISELLGREQVAGVQPDQFDNKYQRAHLGGKLANIVTEIKEGAVIDDAALKAIVSGESCTVEHKHKDPFEIEPFCTCWFGTNHMPHTRDFSDALFRRALVIKFNNQFKPELGNADPDLANKIIKSELEGVLMMALNAYADALQNGFTVPASARQAISDWRIEADQIAQLIDAGYLETGSTNKMRLRDGYNKYRQWCDDVGIGRRVTEKTFSQRLERLGYIKRRKSDGVYFEGIGVNLIQY